MGNDENLNVKNYVEKLRTWGKKYNIMLEGSKETNAGNFSMNAKAKDEFAYFKKMDELLFFWIKNNRGTSRTLRLWQSYRGTGIVICVNNKYAKMAYSTITMMRQAHHSSLPVEVFYQGENDLSAHNRKLFNRIPKVKLVNIEEIFDLEAIKVWGWSMKSFSLLASSFETAMLIDADTVFLQQPEHFFNTHSFREHGALFFKDRTIPRTDRAVLKNSLKFLAMLFPDGSNQRLKENRFYTGKSEHHQESGMVVVDKKGRFSGLLAACILNSGDIRLVSSKYIHGDKETFWMGFEIMDQDYIFNRYAPGPVGAIPTDLGAGLCSVQLFHVDEYYKPAWVNGGMLHNKNENQLKVANMEAWAVEPGRWSQGHYYNLCLVSKINRFNNEEKKIISKLVEVYQRSVNEFESNNEIIKIPRISPWSYDTLPCTDNTYTSEFTHWTKGRVWDNYNDHFYVKFKLELAAYIKDYKPVSDSFYGRGILYSCHPRIFKVTMTSIKLLRHFGCILPIEIWHYDELEGTHIKKLESISGVKVRNLADFIFYSFPRDNDGKIFALKTAAVLHSKFDQILFLDGDNNPVRDPTFLFDSAPFLETGALFWKDMWKTRPDNPLWNVLGLDCVDEFEQESGQMAIKKSAPGVRKALDVAYFMQMQGDMYFTLTCGDKDTFRLSWRLLGLPFHLVRPHMAVLGPYPGSRGKFCGKSMVQYAPYWGKKEYGMAPVGHQEKSKPEILFIHANSLKYQAELGREPLFGQLRHYTSPINLQAVGVFIQKDICVDLLDTENEKIQVDDFRDTLPDFEDLFRKFHKEQ